MEYDQREVKQSYRTKLHTLQWSEFSEQEIERQGGSCWACGSEDNLVVHHLRYVWGKDPWDYESNDLRILCKDCHRAIHAAADLVWVECLSFEPHELELILKRMREHRRREDDVPKMLRELFQSVKRVP